MREIIRASALNGFRELVDELGGDSVEILAAAHLSPEDLAEGDRYLPLRAYIDCQEIAAQRLGRPDFGLVFGQRQSISMLGPLSLAILNAPTARAGIEVAAKYMHIHNPAFTMSLAPVPRQSRDFLSFGIHLRRPARREQNLERAMSSVHKSLGQIGGKDYRPLQVWFEHQPISALSVYKRVFGVAPEFGKPISGIAIERSVLDAWRPGGSPQLRNLAESFLRSIAPARADSFSTRVRAMAHGLLRGGECTPEAAARALGMHPRTLQRRLKEEGSTFEQIKDDVRRELAESLLGQPNVSLTRIAALLDYADASAFSRSARRWFGEPPRAVRKRLTTGPKTRAAAGARTNPLAVARRLHAPDR